MTGYIPLHIEHRSPLEEDHRGLIHLLLDHLQAGHGQYQHLLQVLCIEKTVWIGQQSKEIKQNRLDTLL
jgi:hypothetical protein